MNNSLSKGLHCNEILDLGNISVPKFGDRVASPKPQKVDLPPIDLAGVNMDLPPVAPSELHSNPSCGSALSTNTQFSFSNDRSPTVLGSLDDEFLVNELTKSKGDLSEELLPVLQRITRGYHRIIKPNPRYAMIVAALDVVVLHSYRLALSKAE